MIRNPDDGTTFDLPGVVKKILVDPSEDDKRYVIEYTGPGGSTVEKTIESKDFHSREETPWKYHNVRNIPFRILEKECDCCHHIKDDEKCDTCKPKHEKLGRELKNGLRALERHCCFTIDNVCYADIDKVRAWVDAYHKTPS